ncbi:MAG: hypothetical protein JWS10_783 [Cypionkella sp.]|nr:hypothetical protein [Cypionkella sp.]
MPLKGPDKTLVPERPTSVLEISSERHFAKCRNACSNRAASGGPSSKRFSVWVAEIVMGDTGLDNPQTPIGRASSRAGYR